MAEQRDLVRTDIDPDEDRYPNVFDVLTVVQQVDTLENGPVERIEITCLASGEATYRIWPARAEEPQQGYFPQI